MGELYSVGRLLGIARKPAPGAPLVPLAMVVLTRATGVAGDARGRPGRRQVTVLEEHGWEAALAAAGVELPWTARRANLFVAGLALAGAVDAVLRIGCEARLRVTGESDPCARMDAVAPGLAAALAPAWRGGVTCRVIADGPIAVGDRIELWPAPAVRG